MPIRKANAEWDGTLSKGNGKIFTDSGSVNAPYSFVSRFENGRGTNPEELLGAAHAGCFSMALAMLLEQSGFIPNKVMTTAQVHIGKEKNGFVISMIELETQCQINGIDEKTFAEKAEAAKKGCPVSMALASTNITLKARLLRE
ncbi:MAG: OsmC family protein [Chitinispirillaceae bacterium]|nr:OsmC family protein [Chitinispirillaceae bacterium]